MGGWPLLEGSSWQDKNFKWFELIFKLRDMGYSSDYIVDLSVTTDMMNSSWRILDLNQPVLGIPREYLVKGSNDTDVKVF